MTGQQLAEIRHRLGLSQEAFANALGFSRHATVSDWETGKKPIPKVVQLLASELSKRGRLG